MTAATAAKWAERVQAWRASGKTAEEYASGFDFESTTLRYWASRLKTQTISKSTEAPSAPTATIARVVRARTVPEPVAPTASALEVVIGEARVVVRSGFDQEVLRQVVAALGGAR